MKYSATVMVEYHFEVEADSQEEAEHIAHSTYHEHEMFSDVYSVDCYDLEEDE